MATPGLLIVLKAKTGKEEALSIFLSSGLAMVAREQGVRTWYSFRITDKSFGIYDSFASDNAREEHFRGQLLKALEEVEEELLEAPPDITKIDILASKH